MENRIKHIEVVPYNPNWPNMFEVEAALIKKAITNNIINIYHIGSTSVSGLKAKQDLDILCVVKNLPDSLLLDKLGYLFKGELNIPLRYYFSKNNSQSKVNLHVVEEDHGFIARNLCFRDYLREHKDVCIEYANLKEQLLKDPNSYQRSNLTFTNYNLGKHRFIKAVLEKARFNGLCIGFCMHHEEWDRYHYIKEQQIFNSTSVTYDRNHPSISEKNNYHFILYKGVNIVSVAQVELLLKDSEVIALRSLATDSPYKQQGYGSYIMKAIEKWGKYKGKKIIKTHARLSAEQFYRNLGYSDMLFDDPSIQQEYIDLAKEL